MRSGLALTLAVALLLWLSGCGLTEEDVRQLADASAATTLAAIPTATPAPTATPQPTPHPPTPQPTPSPITFPPTATPQLIPPQSPTATPQPTPTPVTIPPTATPQPTSTPQPAATPQPTATPVTIPPTPTALPAPTPRSSSGVTALGGQASGPTVFRLEGDSSLKVDPAEPLAGRDVFFTLDGLLPWQEVTVEFVDPRGAPAQWVTEEEVTIFEADGGLATQRLFHADGSGQVSWLRVGTRDQEGVWSVRITVDGETSGIAYPVDQRQLADQDTETLGVDLRRYQGSVSNTYSSALVPATLAVDLQSHLAWVMDRFEDSLGIRSSQIPDIYLAGNSSLLRQIAEATGDGIGFEDGFYRSGGSRPGIYLRTDFFRTSLQGILTHEFVHLFFLEVAGGEALPAWLSEGMARYYEYELGLLGARPDAVRIPMFRDTDLARSAAIADNLLSLTALESQAGWNSQTDDSRITLQYAEAYMAVRFLIETYGAGSAVEMVRIIGQGSILAGAMLEVTGSQYRDFRKQFAEWLGDWEDPERIAIQEYIQPLDSIMGAVSLISARRSADLVSGAPVSSRIVTKRGLARDATALLTQAQGLSPPSTLQDLHQEALTYLGVMVDWLSLELEYAETLVEAKLVQANDMIPEINARDLSLVRSINTAQFVYNIQE